MVNNSIGKQEAGRFTEPMEGTYPYDVRGEGTSDIRGVPTESPLTFTFQLKCKCGTYMTLIAEKAFSELWECSQCGSLTRVKC